MEELKVMGFGAVLDKTFRCLISKNFFKIFSIFNGVILLILTLLFISFAFSFNFNFSEASNVFDNFQFNPRMLVVIITCILSIPIYIFSSIMLSGSIAGIVINKFLNQEYTVKDILVNVFKKFWTIFLNFIIFFIVNIVISIAVLIITGLTAGVTSLVNSSIINIIFYIFIFIISIIIRIIYIVLITFFSLSLPSILYENKGPIKAIFRSIKLILHDFWKVLGSYLLFFFILFAGFYFILIIFFGFFMLIYFLIYYFIFNGTGDFSNNILFLLMFLILIPLYILFMNIFYAFYFSFNCIVFFNQKIKNEGFGVEKLVESLINS